MPDLATLPALDNALKLRAEMRSGFVGRDAEIDGLFIALIARTHMLLLGPPGTAKSLLTQTFAGALPGAYFQRLLTAFTAPEEVFGPFDLAGLDAGKYERAIDGYMPTSTTAFLDEVFKANSAILNALLTQLNEREFDNGTTRVKTPLQLCVGASNEYPADASLGALYDRFMVRFWTDYVPTRADRLKLLTCPDPASVVKTTLSAEDVATLQAECGGVVVPPDVLEALLDIQERLAKEHGLVVSDRRLRASLKLVKAKALLSGRNHARKSDLSVLADSVWQKHEERPSVMAVVLDVAAPGLAKLQEMADAVREIHNSIAHFDREADLQGKLTKIMDIEAAAKNLADHGDVDHAAVMNEIAGLRKAVARGFALASGLLAGLGA